MSYHEVILFYAHGLCDPVGAIHYDNGRYKWLEPGFYKITAIYPDKGNLQRAVVYGDMVFPVVVSDCDALRVEQIINRPNQCGHSWHAGPKRPASSEIRK